MHSSTKSRFSARTKAISKARRVHVLSRPSTLRAGRKMRQSAKRMSNVIERRLAKDQCDSGYDDYLNGRLDYFFFSAKPVRAEKEKLNCK